MARDILSILSLLERFSKTSLGGSTRASFNFLTLTFTHLIPNYFIVQSFFVSPLFPAFAYNCSSFLGVWRIYHLSIFSTRAWAVKWMTEGGVCNKKACFFFSLPFFLFDFLSMKIFRCHPTHLPSILSLAILPRSLFTVVCIFVLYLVCFFSRSCQAIYLVRERTPKVPRLLFSPFYTATSGGSLVA